MEKGSTVTNNNIGTAIQYFRESYRITQGNLCKGLCSVATLSRIETGERDVDSLLLETLLERLGRMPNQFELILTDFDYMLYLKREEIKRQIEEQNCEKAHELLREYEKSAGSKGTPHRQFIMNSRAWLNDAEGGAVEKTIELLMEAIVCTVPDFKTYNIKNYYLSNPEINIIIDMIQHMVLAGARDKAKDILNQVIEYLERQAVTEENNSVYTKVAVMASKLYMEEGDMLRAGKMCELGLEKSKGIRKMDYLGDLYIIKAKSMEALLEEDRGQKEARMKCVKAYLQAYYVYDFCEEHSEAEKIREHLQEVYQWVDID